MNINLNNYEEYFISYMEGELTAAERNRVEEFVAEHPGLRSELHLFQLTKLEPDESKVFAGKNNLLKQPATTRIVYLQKHIWKIAAALLLLVGGATVVWLNNPQHTKLPTAEVIPSTSTTVDSSIDQSVPVVQTPAPTTPIAMQHSAVAVIEKEEQPTSAATNNYAAVNSTPVLEQQPAIRQVSEQKNLLESPVAVQIPQQTSITKETLPRAIQQEVEPVIVANNISSGKLMAHVPIAFNQKTRAFVTAAGGLIARIAKARRDDEPLQLPNDKVHLAAGNFEFTYVKGN